jgi:hypothetical protein
MQAVITRLLQVSQRLSSLSETTATYRDTRSIIAAALAEIADECLWIVEELKTASEKKDRS